MTGAGCDDGLGLLRVWGGADQEGERSPAVDEVDPAAGHGFRLGAQGGDEMLLEVRITPTRWRYSCEDRLPPVRLAQFQCSLTLTSPE
jgi:hypothetical protein